MKKILINYDYKYYPFTTASYLEMAARRRHDLKCFRAGQIDPGKVDLIINVMPCSKLVSAPRVPSCYYEIDCHLIQGKNTDFYADVDRVFIAQDAFLKLYPLDKTYYLPLGCDPLLHHRFRGVKQRWDIGFIGNDTYPLRRRLLDQLGTKYRVLRTNTQPGLPYSRALSSCALTFNCSMNQDVNMRFFEALAIGRLLITDYLPAQDQFAVAGKMYETFTDWHDLDQKVSYYLSHENEREAFALNGSNYIRRHHTYDNRLEEILRRFAWKVS